MIRRIDHDMTTRICANTRRRALRTLGAALLAAVAPTARTQGAAAVPHVGYLSVGSPATNAAFLEALRNGLREFGYVDGKNIVIDVRWAGSAAYQFPEIAATLVKTKPAAIVTTCVPSTRAAKDATRTIPVVMSVDGDPVSAGLVASLARPGANVTGTSTLFEQLIPKWLELLRLVVPQARAIAILRNPEDLVDPYLWIRFEEAARGAGVRIIPGVARVRADLSDAFAGMERQGAEGLIVMTEAFLAGEIDPIVPLAERHRLPAIYGFREFAEAGGLMSYGVSFRDYYRGVARYVDAVLKGARPANLPVEQPTTIELVINLQAARQLSLAIPAPLLARADRVIS